MIGSAVQPGSASRSTACTNGRSGSRSPWPCRPSWPSTPPRLPHRSPSGSKRTWREGCRHTQRGSTSVRSASQSKGRPPRRLRAHPSSTCWLPPRLGSRYRRIALCPAHADGLGSMHENGAHRSLGPVVRRPFGRSPSGRPGSFGSRATCGNRRRHARRAPGSGAWQCGTRERSQGPAALCFRRGWRSPLTAQLGCRFGRQRCSGPVPPQLERPHASRRESTHQRFCTCWEPSAKVLGRP
mmetsp:Transcript_14990/g.35387  ORF Transcript_14990/g.35387 Transcript_14990/m.35387 type:complete len:240 (-) Transcript_14990:472-1191(-)